MTEMITLACDYCKTVFDRRLSEHINNTNRGRKNVFCSAVCGNTFHRKDLLIYICQNPECGKPFSRRKETHDQLKYCSRKCGAKLASRSRSRGTVPLVKIYSCNKCGKPFKSTKNSKCKECLQEEFLLTTLEEYIAGLKTSHKHAKVRVHARLQYSGPLECLNCGYTLHVEIAHIKALKDFPLSATIGEINSPDNLMALDKRCHWEYDNGYLRYEDGKIFPIIK